MLNQHRVAVCPSVIEADHNGVRERDGERAPYYRLFYQMTRMVRPKGTPAQDDRIDALVGVIAFCTRHLAWDTDQAVLDHNEATFNMELEKFMRHTLGNKHQPQRRWASTTLAGTTHRRG